MASLFQRFLDENGLTQAEIACLLDVIPSTVSKKATGDRPWKLTEIQAILAFLTARLARPVTYEELFGSPAEAATTDAEPVQEPAC